MQAILTRCLPCTNTRPARITASCDAGKLTITYPTSKSTADAHRIAARALMDSLGWTQGDIFGRIATGQLPGGKGYAHVFINRFCEE